MESLGGRAGTSLTPELDQRVIWLGLTGSRSATVKWTGILPEISGQEITLGLAFDSSLEFGGGEGKWKGRRLFSCEPGCGLFVPASSVIAEACLVPHLSNNVTESNSSRSSVSSHSSSATNLVLSLPTTM
uniref:CAP-Gly domain-containing protein n=1 Tax=Cacopsylla melanoneura TaxID=428564 RepID=A0A8D8SZW6_9HEMI